MAPCTHLVNLPPARGNRWWLIPALALALGAPALAQPEVSWWTVDGGGGMSSGGSFEVTGTAGQPDAGGATGGSSDLESGFWYADHPFVPVELQSFEIVSNRSVEPASGSPADAPSCRQDGEPSDSTRAQGPPSAGDRPLAAARR